MHRNQATRDLGKMAFGILQAFINRCEQLDMIHVKAEMARILRQFQVNGELIEQQEFTIIEEERPPMKTIPAYREKFHP